MSNSSSSNNNQPNQPTNQTKLNKNKFNNKSFISKTAKKTATFLLGHAQQHVLQTPDPTLQQPHRHAH